MAYCIRCGSEISGDKNCPICGMEVNSAMEKKNRAINKQSQSVYSDSDERSRGKSFSAMCKGTLGRVFHVIALVAFLVFSVVATNGNLDLTLFLSIAVWAAFLIVVIFDICVNIGKPILRLCSTTRAFIPKLILWTFFIAGPLFVVYIDRNVYPIPQPTVEDPMHGASVLDANDLNRAGGVLSPHTINNFLVFWVDILGYYLLFMVLFLFVDKAIYPLFDNGKYAVSKGSFFKLLFLYKPLRKSDEGLPFVRWRDKFVKEVFIEEKVAYNPDDGFKSRVGSLLRSQSSLESISVSEKNQYLCSVDGLLFTKDGKTLVRYPSGRDVDGYDVPEGFEKIAAGAFAYCSSLTSIAIPKSVDVIDVYAFADCSSLTSIDVDLNNLKYRSIDGVLFTKNGKTLVRYPEGKKNESYVVPEGTTAIAAAFLDCSNLTSVSIPEGTRSIGVMAFQNCTSLNTIVIPDGTFYIGERAFADCKSLNSVAIPGSVTSIEASTFAGCSSLSEVVVCEGVTSIKKSAFACCPSLKNVVLPSSVTSIGDSTFDERCTFECDFPKGSYAEEFVKTHAKKFGRKYGIKRAKKKRSSENKYEDKRR